jgi:intracellular multiplication protein IcmE
MASKYDNIKSLGKNSRTRVVIFFTASILIGSVLYGYFKLKNRGTLGVASEASIGGSPNIQSIPGALNQTAQYSNLQNQQNIQQAETALKTGASAIPTIVSMKKFDGTQAIGPQGGTGGLGFSSLALLDNGPVKPLWLQNLGETNCAKDSLKTAVQNGAKISDLKDYCNCSQLKNFGFSLSDIQSVCDCRELRLLGYSALDLKNLGYNASELRNCGYSACEEKASGFSAAEMKNAGFGDGELKGAGFNPEDVDSVSGLPHGMSPSDIQKNNCSPDYLKELKAKGVSGAAIRRISGCDAQQLLASGFTPKDLKDAGFTPSDLLNAGVSPNDLKNAGFGAKSLLDAGLTPDDLKSLGYTPEQLRTAGVSSKALAGDGTNEGLTPDALSKLIAAHQVSCTVDSIKKELAQGMTAAEIHQKFGCDAAALLKGGISPAELVKAGFTPAELANSGLSPADLLKAGYTPADLKAAGYSAKDLLAAGVSPKDLLDAGFTPDDALKAGVSPADLLKAGVPVKALKNLGVDAKTLLAAGASPKDLKDAGFMADDLKNAGVDDATIGGLGLNPKADALASLANIPDANANKDANNPLGGPLLSPTNQNTQNLDKLNDVLQDQKKMQAQQKFQQKISQRAATIQAYANQLLQGWKTVTAQTYVAGAEKQKKDAVSSGMSAGNPASNKADAINKTGQTALSDAGLYVKTGDILFAVIDTAVNTDEPGPILATIVSGPLKNSKIIGSFTSGANAEKLTMSFNTLSIPGESKTIGISAYAIDPNTGRTALSSSTDHHYLMRYGSLFASTFLEGFGNAFQSADTQITIGGTGGTTNTTVQNGINRSLTDNAVIGLATLGKAWGQQAQKNMNVPTTIQVYSGTPIGVLFLQDVTLDTKG